ncbi:MAG TPA: signal peptidase II [bacterium]|nr:signal peptidase II [bacterium]HPN67099.1 signal peptidase II [bacterium]
MNNDVGKKMILPNSVWWLLIATLSFLVDQLVKIFLITGWWAERDIFDWLRIDIVFNHGLAFGLGDGYGLMVSMAAFLLFVYFLFTNIDWWYNSVFLQVGVGLVFGGAISNLVDRFRFGGGVVDYIDLPFYSVFNLADVFILVGLLILIYKFWNYDNIRK